MLAALAATLLLLIAYVVLATAGARYSHVEDVPAERVAIVFGAGLRRDGSPSLILADRVNAAVALYQQGTVSRLLMTGDNSSANYDEVTAMQEFAVGKGVPAEHITRDFAGFSTYESCYRARAIFGVERAVLVTQGYHLPRAVYTCQQLGIAAVGLGTPDWERYRPSIMTRYVIREGVAILNALVQTHITRPEPTFLGPFEGIE